MSTPTLPPSSIPCGRANKWLWLIRYNHPCHPNQNTSQLFMSRSNFTDRFKTGKAQVISWGFYIFTVSLELKCSVALENNKSEVTVFPFVTKLLQLIHNRWTTAASVPLLTIQIRAADFEPVSNAVLFGIGRVMRSRWPNMTTKYLWRNIKRPLESHDKPLTSTHGGLKTTEIMSAFILGKTCNSLWSFLFFLLAVSNQHNLNRLSTKKK